MSKTERGFTMLELAVTLAIMGIVVALSTPGMVNEINQRRANVAVQETQMIVDAARSYRMAKGVWPGDATCSNALNVLATSSPAYLPAMGPFNKFNSALSTSCTTTSFSVDQNAVADWDGYVANGLPFTTIVNAGTNQLRTPVGLPGSEPAMDAKLSRVATGNAELNRMRTDLLLGGNNISEINALTANSGRIVSLNSDEATVNGTLVAGNATVNGTLNAGTGNITQLNAQNATVYGTINSGTSNTTQMNAQNAQVNGVLTAGTGNITTLNANSAGINTLFANSGSITGLGTGNLSVSQAAVINGILSVAGESQFNGRAVFNADVILNKVVSKGAGCAPSGAIARSPAGGLLSCQNGIWSGGGIGSIVSRNTTASTSAYVYCQGSEVLVGGGGFCAAGSSGRLKANTPNGNGWEATCPGDVATAVALCAQ